MNERIKTLRRLAIDELNQHFLSCPDNWDELVQEKVAELIVRECAGLFEIEWGEENLTGNDVGYVLKKHFGVDK